MNWLILLLEIGMGLLVVGLIPFSEITDIPAATFIAPGGLAVFFAIGAIEGLSLFVLILWLVGTLLAILLDPLTRRYHNFGFKLPTRVIVTKNGSMGLLFLTAYFLGCTLA